MKDKLTLYIEYYSNGNIFIKGQRNSKAQEEELWEEFYENGNIRWRVSLNRDKKDGIEEEFDEQGNITKTRVWKDGELIETTKH